jgi:hypothetical protein
MFRCGIRPKFLYLLRNPFDRIESHWNYMRNDPRWRLGIVDEHLVQTSDYFLQLEQYRRFFAREDILLLDFDVLRADPAAAMKHALGFLGLPGHSDLGAAAPKNVTQLQSGLERVLRKWNAQRLWAHLPGSVRRRMKNVLRRAAQRQRRVLTDSERSLVREQLNPGMIRLREHYGVDVARWGF